jgi:citrate lyase subunit beta/citryl-CoA lyase
MRSMLFVPGDRPERFAKALASGADALILDLEDAVAVEKRGYARDCIREFLGASPRGGRCWVRINPVGSGEALADLAAVMPVRPDGIVLPKARSVADLQRADHWLEALESAHGLEAGSTPLLPLVTETAASVLRMAGYLDMPARVTGLSWGAEDLAADLGALANRTPEGEFEPPYLLARTLCLYAAAGAGVLAIDTVDTEIRDLDAVARRARDSRRLGFVGKLAIHPAQIPPIHAAFTPSAEEIDWAGRVRAAFAANPGSGVLALDGRMLDKPHLRQAERILAAARGAAVD